MGLGERESCKERSQSKCTLACHSPSSRFTVTLCKSAVPYAVPSPAFAPHSLLKMRFGILLLLAPFLLLLTFRSSFFALAVGLVTVAHGLP